jgi:photosystem II stability/assembly factor-like uncharacterized protein
MKKIILYTILLLFVAANLFSQGKEIIGGSLSAWVTCFATKGNNIYAGTCGGVFLSTDKGNSWTEKNIGLTYTSVQAIAIIDTNIFVGTHLGGVFLSMDLGGSWARKNRELIDWDVNALAIKGKFIFASTYWEASVYSSFLRYDDEDSIQIRWSKKNNALPDVKVRSIVISGDNMFAATEGGVFYSTDNGNNWTPKNNGITNLNIYTLAIMGDDIFAGTWGAGIFHSADNGNTWTQKNIGLTGNLFVPEP